MSSDVYLLPTPEASEFMVGEEITNWTKEMLEAAASAKATLCDMSDMMLDLCYAPTFISVESDGAITVAVSALSSSPATDTQIELQAINFVAHYDPATNKITYTNVSDAQTSISDKREVYLLPSPKGSYVVNAEIRNWTLDMLETAMTAEVVLCNMTSYIGFPCYAPAKIRVQSSGSITVEVSAFNLLATDIEEVSAHAILFIAEFDIETFRATFIEVQKGRASIGGESADPYVVVASGSKDMGFAHMPTNPMTYNSPTQFTVQFGFAFTDLMQAADKPLLLKTRDVDGNKCTMTATSCINDGNNMRIYFMHNDRQYYCRSTDGGTTVTVGAHDYITQVD